MSFFSLLQSSPTALITFCTAAGLLTGSFLNVVIYRLPRMMEREWQQQCHELQGETVPVLPPFNLAVPRSACPGCGHQITALENIPVLSYLFLRGKCSQCHTTIPLRYPAIELLAGMLGGFAAYHFGYGLLTPAALVFCWALLALAFIDLDTQLLPDSITLPLLWIGLLVNLGGNGFTDLHSAVTGAIGGYLILWSVYWCFKLTTGKEGMGYGDFKLLAAMGAWLGWKMLPMIILLSSVAGAVIGTTFILAAGLKRNTPIPFGPYLACGGLLALFWGSRFNHTFLGIS